MQFAILGATNYGLPLGGLRLRPFSWSGSAPSGALIRCHVLRARFTIGIVFSAPILGFVWFFQRLLGFPRFWPVFFEKHCFFARSKSCAFEKRVKYSCAFVRSTVLPRETQLCFLKKRSTIVLPFSHKTLLCFCFS